MGQKIKCNKCGEILESLYRHDFHYCSCKSVAIDGGSDYTRILGSKENWSFVEDIAEQGLKNE
jgi:hypothetical protein